MEVYSVSIDRFPQEGVKVYFHKHDATETAKTYKLCLNGVHIATKSKNNFDKLTTDSYGNYIVWFTDKTKKEYWIKWIINTMLDELKTEKKEIEKANTNLLEYWHLQGYKDE